ncbi:MAG: ABC transporter substrate-binding protein [Rhodospirillales bacterium]|nr:ABC transporter substrate-binding protein [Rhodospirillales bacterium]
MPATLTLRAAIADYPHVRALRDGSVCSERVAFEFVAISPISRAFRPMAGELAFDLSEMAVATLAMARAKSVPIIGLSCVLMRGFHHAALVCPASSPLRGPADLAGKRIGVRAWSQTTGVWLRGILADEQGLDPAACTWVTTEGAHVADCPDPPYVVRAPEGADLAAMLRAGEIDAGIALTGLDPAATRTVIPDAADAAAAWYRRRGIYPVNHALCLREDLIAAHPWLPGELMRLFQAAKDAAPAPKAPAALEGADPLPYGIAANRAAIETLMRYAAAQGLIPAAPRAEDLFAI